MVRFDVLILWWVWFSMVFLRCFSKSVIRFSISVEAGGGFQSLSFTYICGMYDPEGEGLFFSRYCFVRMLYAILSRYFFMSGV